MAHHNTVNLPKSRGTRQCLQAAYVAFALGIVAPNANAQSLTIQGKVMDGSGQPVSGAATEFRVRIRAPDGSGCVLFDETHIFDMTDSAGLFSINLNDGSGSANLPTTYTLEAALSNRAPLSVNSSYCSSGSGLVTYTPGPNDNRRVEIEFRDPALMATAETIPEMDLNPVAFAMEARTVGGFPASSFLRVVGGGVPGTAPTLTAAEVSDLQAIVAGTSVKYMGRTAVNGAQMPSYSGSPTTPVAGSVWFDNTDGSLKFHDGITVQTVGTGAGGASGTASGDLSGSYPGPTVAKLQGIGVTAGTPTSNQTLKYDGSNWAAANLSLSDLFNSTAGSAMGSAVCTAGETMYYDTISKELRCQAISAASIATGILPVANGGTGATTLDGAGLVQKTGAQTITGVKTFTSLITGALQVTGGSPVAGQVLTSDASGIATWANLPAAGVSSLSVSAPLQSTGGSTPALSMPAATNSAGGYLTSADWIAFNAKAPLASPALTGTPTAPTAAVNNSTTQVATTAFVLGQLASASPLMNGSAAAGSGTTFARADHVHPTDTSRAPAGGSASIAALGTVTSGTWNATAITVPYGGTGLSYGTAGGIPYFASGTTMASTAAGTSGQVLTSNGSGAPTWQAAPASFTGAAPRVTSRNLAAPPRWEVRCFLRRARTWVSAPQPLTPPCKCKAPSPEKPRLPLAARP